MSLTAIRSISKLSRILPSSRILLPYNCVSKSLFRFGDNTQNARTLTRSLFFFCRSRDSSSDFAGTIGSKVSLTNRCGCGCGLHTKGDQELAAFLAEEIENEKKLQMSSELPQLEDFECKLEGAEVTLTKKVDRETITIRTNVNNSVDAEETVMDPNETKEPQEEMKSKPEFTIEIQKGKKTLSFQCSYVNSMPDEEASEAYNDSFQIAEVSLYEGEFEDSTYSVSGDIMDGYLYDLLMNYLQERGISNEFADKMVAFFTSYEHKLYINLLQGMKNFVEK